MIANIIGIIGGILGMLSFYYVYQKFPSETHPLIKERPYEFSLTENGWKTMLEVVNYSGFDAYSVTFDFKYGNNDWVSEWTKAKEDSKKKQSEELPRLKSIITSATTSQVVVEDIDKPKENDSTTSKERSQEFKIDTLGARSIRKFAVTVSGAPSKPDFCKKKSDSEIVFVRTIWKNKYQQTFDNLRKYMLICTKVGNGQSYTFLPADGE